MKHRSWTLAGAVALAMLAQAAAAQTALTPKAQYSADSQAATARYNSDKTLCNDEASSSARLQCRRDAKAEYDKAMAAAKARLAAASPTTASGTAACAGCGKVTAVAVIEKAGEGSALGLIAGGAAGAILGHQVGSGTGQDLATVAGALGGAYAGKKIEEKAKTHKVWQISVQYQDGSKGSFEFNQDPGFQVGDAVRKSGDTLVR